MAGLHVLPRAVILATVVGVGSVLGGSCTCSDRTVGEQPRGYGEPACLWLITPHAYLVDGSTRVIRDPAQGGRAGTVCLCLAEDEYEALGERLSRVGWPEDGTLLEEFNELALDECKRLAALIEGAVDDECRDYYEHGTWLKDIYFARGQWENGMPAGFTCIEPRAAP